ncbi:MAG TPA: hypothetical protein VG722_06290 [Tepidisphaeraceae bacterium]|nr:hypothetical protein [Tepidisphaeraceae bacterium]
MALEFTISAERALTADEVNKTFRRAWLRCLSSKALFRRLYFRWNDPRYTELVTELLSRDLNQAESELFFQGLQNFLAKAEKWPSPEKHRVERIAYRLCRQLAAEQAAIIGLECIKSPRLGKRRIAIRLFKQFGIVKDAVPILIGLACDLGDHDSAELLARDPRDLGPNNLDTLLSVLNEDYWKARVFEWMLTNRMPEVLLLANSYPTAFVWAAGRISDPNLIPVMTQLVVEHPEDFKLLQFYIWALGKMRAQRELGAARRLAIQRLSAGMNRLGREPIS